jgi:DNA repair protein RadC
MVLRELHITWVERLEPALTISEPVSVPGDVARVLASLLGSEVVEVFGVLCLSTRCHVLGYHEVSRGTLDAALVHPREVFKPAVLTNAAALVIAHNHPSGDPTPSADDRLITDRLLRAAEIMGIPVLDHIIIGSAGRYYSFHESRGP